MGFPYTILFLEVIGKQDKLLRCYSSATSTPPSTKLYSERLLSTAELSSHFCHKGGTLAVHTQYPLYKVYMELIVRGYHPKGTAIFPHDYAISGGACAEV